ncbi:hypothetical protein [Azospirillum canadense]|uniref:hypothetical protein n=1 Tax=Azospirillum canadense TaxID=403962 RepID=UPI002227B152|nr:hypothetical protein [Azospirillum canadense]MCW2238161.1 hypothetical protein [Azospirillum canadense]
MSDHFHTGSQSNRVNVTLELPLDVYKRLDRRARYMSMTVDSLVTAILAQQLYDTSLRNMD